MHKLTQLPVFNAFMFDDVTVTLKFKDDGLQLPLTSLKQLLD